MENQINLPGTANDQLNELHKELAEQKEYIKLLQSYVSELGSMNTSYMRKELDCKNCLKLKEKEQYINRLCDQIAESGKTVARMGMQIHEMKTNGIQMPGKFDYKLNLTEKSRQALHIAK